MKLSFYFILLVLLLLGTVSLFQGEETYNNTHTNNGIIQDINTESISDFIMMYKAKNGGYVYNFLLDSTLQDGKILRAYHTDVELTPDNHKFYDNEILDARKLRPLRKFYGNEKRMFFDYDTPGEIKIKTETATDTILNRFVTDDYLFVINGPGSYLLPQALPLDLNYNTEFISLENSYSSNMSLDTLRYELKVIGQESALSQERNIDCFVVEVKSKIKDKGFYVKMWVRKQKPHLPIQSIFITMKMAENPENFVIYAPWKIIEGSME